jgi:hypothetical protein
VIAPFPPLIAVAARWFAHVPLPAAPALSFVDQVNLLLRMFSAASLAMGLLAVYAWLTLLLAIALGFWALLSPIAQIGLLLLIFMPGFLASWQQAQSQGRSFLSNSLLKTPGLEWQDLVLVGAGYVLLGLPVLNALLMPPLFAPPVGNVLVGGALIFLGNQIRKQIVNADP